MVTAKTYFKLGLFTILGFAALIGAAFALGVASLSSETLKYHSYFNESVQGLDLGSPVKYRGVTVGSVSDITIAPDKRHVDVVLAFEYADFRRLGMNAQRADIHVPPDLRAQLGSQGISGVKFVNLDFFDPASTPIEPLPFTPAENTLPVTPSLMKGLEDSLAKALDKLPGMMAAATESLDRIDRFLGDISDAHLADAIVKTLLDLDGAAADAHVVLHQFGQSNLPASTAKAVADADAAINKMSALLDHLDGDAGIVAMTGRATGSVADLSRSVAGGANVLERTLRDLDEAARAVRDLADTIDRKPDILLTGRSAQRTP
jgi:ABC-type transporter Mla subunit MlaD